MNPSGRLLQSARDRSFPDAPCARNISVTVVSGITAILGTEGDQERLLHLDGDLLGGGRLGDLLLVDLLVLLGGLMSAKEI
jgi:hypothetical protein